MTHHPLTGLRVIEMGSGVAAPYVGKLLTDAGAHVTKIESPRGDPLRQWSASGADMADGDDGAFFRYLNGGKQSVALDLETDDGQNRLAELIGRAHLVVDDHNPGDARALSIDPATLRARDPSLVVATLTSFGLSGPWADRPANDFVLQALVGSTATRGIPGEEPYAVGGRLGDFVLAALSAPAVLAATLAASATGVGAHVDGSQYEAMRHAFQTYRPIFDAFAPERLGGPQIEIPSIEPASDGFVGFCTLTGQQWQDFCVMIGAPEMGEDPELVGFGERMRRRDEVWERIRSFTTRHTVDELVAMATDFRIPVGPIGTGDVIADIDHFVARGVFEENPHGFTQPRPPYQFSESTLAPVRAAPSLGEGEAPPVADLDPPSLPAGPDQPLAGLRVVDLSAFWAGPIAANTLRALGADVVKVESHVRLDGMRWASGLTKPILWEWSPVYHGANAGKRVINLDLGQPRGLEVLERLIADADVVIENYSPRVTEGWGITWERVRQLNPRTIFVRVPAFGLDGPWRDRVGFAMTMEQVSGLAQRTGSPDGPPLVPRGPVDTIAGMHAIFATLLAVAERERTGLGQHVEVPLIEGALQAAAEQVIEWSAYSNLLTRSGNQSPGAQPQGVYRSVHHDQWLAISVESGDQWQALVGVIDGLAGVDRSDTTAVDAVLSAWAAERPAEPAAAALWGAGVPAAPCVDPEHSARTAQHHQRGFIQWYEHAVAGWVPYFSFPFQIDGHHIELGGPAPLLGEHTVDVLHALGFDDGEIGELEAAGIIGDWPAMVPRPDSD
ncbi:MAG: CaiB/BaiF CoA transferase family protein [Acidimicrobiales bacterium]